MSNDAFKLATRIEEGLYGAVGTSDCHKVGIMGGCGITCWVYLEGRCEVPEENVPNLQTKEDLDTHNKLYGR